MISREHPSWLTQKIPDPSVFPRIKGLLDTVSLHTVCEAAQCPNQGECFACGTATLLIMGTICTRNCTFCAISKGHPLPLDPNEPQHVSRAVTSLGLKHVVITSVTRDDLPDCGAGHFARTVAAIRQGNPGVTIEVLIPDFQGNVGLLNMVVESSPDVIGHNVETVPSLYPDVRPKADYDRSLAILRAVKARNQNIVTKSGFMLGLGERHDQVLPVMRDLRSAGCDCLTIGHYLSPSPQHHRVMRYITPSEFQEYRLTGEEMGFGFVASAPFVRSSFKAEEMYRSIAAKQRTDSNNFQEFTVDQLSSRMG